MATKSNLTLILILITTVLYVASFATPWWFTEFGNNATLLHSLSESASGNSEVRSNCFIDGTCRGANRVHKDNGDAQSIFDGRMNMGD